MKLRKIFLSKVGLTALGVVLVLVGLSFIWKTVQVKEEVTTFDWSKAETGYIVMNQTLDAYQRVYQSTKKSIIEEKEDQRLILKVLHEEAESVDEQIFTELYNAVKAYTEAGDLFLGWLDTSVSYYERHLASIGSKDEKEYLVTRDLIDRHEVNKEQLLGDFIQARRDKEEIEREVYR